VHIIMFTYRRVLTPYLMPSLKSNPAKRAALQKTGTLHPHPNTVTSPLFQDSDFFDPSDLLQVKYEMLRRVEVDQHSIRQASDEFGFSRPAFYQAQAAFQTVGLGGLVPRKRGPRQGHKLTPAILDFLQQSHLAQPDLDPSDLAEQVHQRFGVVMHPRTFQRGLQRLQKKRR